MIILPVQKIQVNIVGQDELHFSKTFQKLTTSHFLRDKPIFIQFLLTIVVKKVNVSQFRSDNSWHSMSRYLHYNYIEKAVCSFTSIGSYSSHAWELICSYALDILSTQYQPAKFKLLFFLSCLWLTFWHANKIKILFCHRN